MSKVTQKFKQAMEDVGKIYNKRIDAKMIEVYANSLDGFSLNQAASVLFDLCGTSAHFPRPYQIKELMQAPEPVATDKPPLDDWATQCESAWNRLKRAILNGSKHFDFDDDLHAQKALDVDGYSNYALLADADQRHWAAAQYGFNRQYIRFCYADFLRNKRAQK